MPPNTRDKVVDFINELREFTGLPIKALLAWAQLHKGRFYDWRRVCMALMEWARLYADQDWPPNEASQVTE